MSDYTMTLKRCSDIYGKNEVRDWFKQYELSDFLTQDQINDISSFNTFGIYFFDKTRLANLIYDHYLYREIAYETPAMFKHYTKVKLNEIMGKYLPLIWSASIRYNPLEDKTFNFTETFEKEKENTENKSSLNNINSEGSSNTSGSSSSTSASGSSSLNVNSDTPQGQISKIEILGGKYASQTSANESSNNISDTTNSSSSNSLENSETRNSNENKEFDEKENYVKKKSGYDLKLTTMEKIEMYRKTIQNYNLQIIEDLNSLFFALY